MCAHRSIALTKRARADLSSIAQYSKREWGIAQQRHYAAKLQTGLDRLTEYPELGRERLDLGDGVREFGIEHHIVYYRATPKTIRVLRVLHKRMDAPTRLTP